MLYAIVDRIVDDYEPVVAAVEADIQEVEHEVFSPERSNPAERIYALEREVLDLHRAIAPLAPAVDKLARGQYSMIDPDLQTYFRDVHDHLLRLSGRIDGFRDLLSSALQANLTQAAVRQNEDVRKISAWVAIIAVPDRHRRGLRHELRVHARAGVALRLPGGDERDRHRLRPPVLALPPLGLALSASGYAVDMPSATDMGQAALASWRGAVANRVAPPAAERTPLSEDQVRAAIGATFFALATFYVVSTGIKMVKTAREKA